jgi:hypothetical protein
VLIFHITLSVIIYYKLYECYCYALYQWQFVRGCCRGEKIFKNDLKNFKKFSKFFVDEKSCCEFFQIFGAIFWACRIFLGAAAPLTSRHCFIQISILLYIDKYLLRLHPKLCIMFRMERFRIKHSKMNAHMRVTSHYYVPSGTQNVLGAWACIWATTLGSKMLHVSMTRSCECSYWQQNNSLIDFKGHIDNEAFDNY